VCRIPTNSRMRIRSAAATSCRPPSIPRYPDDSYFLHTTARDKQYAVFGEGTYAITDQLKSSRWARGFRARNSRSNSENRRHRSCSRPIRAPTTGSKENSFTPKVNIAYQMDPNNLFYATYAKGVPSGRRGNNPLPAGGLCGGDFHQFRYHPVARLLPGQTRCTASRSVRRTTSPTGSASPPACTTSGGRISSRRWYRPSARSPSSPISAKATAKGADIQAEVRGDRCAGRRS